jgi:glycosyltransferase involved in cell wall biosynthesis
VGVSTHTRRLFESYGVPVEGRYFWSPLCIDNDFFRGSPAVPKKYDVMMAGRIIDIKLPDFTVEVLRRLQAARPGFRMLIIGSGDRLQGMLESLRGHGIQVDYPGNIAQADLPGHYRSARVLLFPTKGDCWGLVANEAMAVGVPVITTPAAGAKEDLVRHGENGFVLEPDPGLWVEHILRLLDDADLYAGYSARAAEDVRPYNFDNSAKGIVEAIEHCLGPEGGR